jgi:hypothetical protein
MKLTKTFYYKYTDATESTASIYINIPFKVKKIHVKNITYTAGKNGAQGASASEITQYVTFISSLVGNRPVGMVHKDSQFSMATIQDIEHIFQIPEVINGYYTFTPYTNDGAIAPIFEVIIPDTFYDSFSITIEFNGEDEVF